MMTFLVSAASPPSVVWRRRPRRREILNNIVKKNNLFLPKCNFSYFFISSDPANDTIGTAIIAATAPTQTLEPSNDFNHGNA